MALVLQLRCLREDVAAAGSGGAAAGHQQHGVPGVLRQHAELQLSPARCRHHTQAIFTQCPRVTEASFNKYCDIKSQACNQRNVFLQSGPRTHYTSLVSCSPWRTDPIHSKIQLSHHQRIDHCRTKTKYKRCSLKILTWYFQYLKVLPLMWVD